MPPQRKKLPRRERRFRAAQNAILADTLSDLRRTHPSKIPLHEIAITVRTSMLTQILSKPSQQLLRKYHLPPTTNPHEVLAETVRIITSLKKQKTVVNWEINSEAFRKTFQLSRQLDKYLTAIGLNQQNATKYKDKMWDLISATDRYSSERDY